MKFHPLNDLEAKMSPAVLKKAHQLYEQESLNLKLKELRGKYGIKQTEVAHFSQTAISKLERRKDMRISTLIDYLDSLGMGLEITALPKGNSVEAKKELLLKV